MIRRVVMVVVIVITQHQQSLIPMFLNIFVVVVVVVTCECDDAMRLLLLLKSKQWSRIASFFLVRLLSSCQYRRLSRWNEISPLSPRYRYNISSCKLLVRPNDSPYS